MNVAFPLAIDTTGRTATCGYEEHVKQMIEQVLFTAPGERVNRPTFGCGLGKLLFEPNSEVLASTTQLLVQGSLQQWLGSVINVTAVEVVCEDSTLAVTVNYVLRRTGEEDTTTVVKTL